MRRMKPACLNPWEGASRISKLDATSPPLTKRSSALRNSGGAAHSIEPRIADEFTDALAEISSDALPLRIYSAASSLATFPDSGSPLARKSLVERYGEGIRQIAVSRYAIVYRYVSDTVDVLALVYGPSIVWRHRGN